MQHTFLKTDSLVPLHGMLDQLFAWIARLVDPRKRAEALTVVLERADEERTRAILDQREAGHSWAVVGLSVDRNRESVRIKYRDLAERRR